MKYLNLFSCIVAAGFAVGLAGCQGNERLEEKAGIEGAASARKQIEVDREVAREKEAELSKLKRYYEAIAGEYQGTLQVRDKDASKDFNIRLVITTNPLAYRSGRSRSSDEVTADIQRLWFTVLVTQWDPATAKSGVGCKVSEIRPELDSGELKITGPECDGIYSLMVAEPSTETSASDRSRSKELSAEFSKAILDGKVNSVPQLTGKLYQVRNTQIIDLTLKREK